MSKFKRPGRESTQRCRYRVPGRSAGSELGGRICRRGPVLVLSFWGLLFRRRPQKLDKGNIGRYSQYCSVANCPSGFLLRFFSPAFQCVSGGEKVGRVGGGLRVAFVYSPILDSSKGSEYCQTNVTASLGREIYNPRKKVAEYGRKVPPIPQTQGTGVQFETDLIEHGWKWSPTKVYCQWRRGNGPLGCRTNRVPLTCHWRQLIGQCGEVTG